MRHTSPSGFDSRPPLKSGYSSVWQSARFGTVRSQVQFLFPRPKFYPGSAHLGVGALLQSDRGGFNSHVPDHCGKVQVLPAAQTFGPVSIWDADSLSMRCRRVRFPSGPPTFYWVYGETDHAGLLPRALRVQILLGPLILSSRLGFASPALGARRTCARGSPVWLARWIGRWASTPLGKDRYLGELPR